MDKAITKAIQKAIKVHAGLAQEANVNAATAHANVVDTLVRALQVHRREF